MKQIILTYPTPEGSQEIIFDGESLSFGRGSDADYRLDDDGLSRLNSTIYRDGDYIWIVDENSTNGTFVNSEKVSAGGTPLENGDSVKIGHQTTLKVRISEKQEVAVGSTATNQTKTVSSASANSFGIMPLAITGFALLIIGAAAIFIGLNVFGGSDTATAKNEDFGYDKPLSSFNDEKDKTPTPTPKNADNSNANSSSGDSNEDITDSPESNSGADSKNDVPNGKKYAEMSDTEKNQYIETKALKVARMIGNSDSKTIPPAAIAKIRSFVDAYASRIRVKPLGGCRFGDNLQATYERASKNAPFIISAFNSQGIDPQIGLYLAMIESEHCVCLQSPTGPLGMFQFTQATGRAYGLEIRAGASPSNPDQRCDSEPAANAAAKYMKALTLRYGTGPLSVPLAIGSYNSGEGGLSSNLKTALEKNSSQDRSFWTLIANADSLSKQFQMENIKYVPKFFGAAIVGENPRDFGLNLQSLSTYSK